MLLKHQNTSPFYFTSSAEINWFISLSNLTHMMAQDSAENFNHHCYEIYSDDVFCFIMIPRSPSLPFIVPLGVVVEVFKNFEKTCLKKIIKNFGIFFKNLLQIKFFGFMKKTFLILNKMMKPCDNNTVVFCYVDLIFLSFFKAIYLEKDIQLRNTL